jgi:hypothetical protein
MRYLTRFLVVLFLLPACATAANQYSWEELGVEDPGALNREVPVKVHNSFTSDVTVYFFTPGKLRVGTVTGNSEDDFTVSGGLVRGKTVVLALDPLAGRFTVAPLGFYLPFTTTEITVRVMPSLHMSYLDWRWN